MKDTTRYVRQISFSMLGEAGQEKLSRGRVVIIGCGALGGNIANLLVRAGTGTVRIVDQDLVEERNLHRQVLFDEDDINAPKVRAAEKHLERINSTVKIEGIVARAGRENIEELCRGADVIMDGLDNAETRFLLNDVSLKMGVPWVYGGVAGSTGMTMTVVPGVTPCFRCIFPEPTPSACPRSDTGILGTVPGVIGALQATEAIKLLTGSKDFNRYLLVMDLWKNTFQGMNVEKREGCPACRGTYEFLDAADA